MKTDELAKATAKIAYWLNATETDRMVELITDIKDASIRPLKKSKEVFVVRRVRISRPSVHYAPFFAWVPCDKEGNALTATGRKMSGDFDAIAWR